VLLYLFLTKDEIRRKFHGARGDVGDCQLMKLHGEPGAESGLMSSPKFANRWIMAATQLRCTFANHSGGVASGFGVGGARVNYTLQDEFQTCFRGMIIRRYV
jgi:hypothetical protein